jgi:hypothetical protein
MVQIILLLAVAGDDPHSWYFEALERRAGFTRVHRGAFATPLEVDAADSKHTPAAWHAGDRVCYAWHSDGEIRLVTCTPQGRVASKAEALGAGRLPRITADGKRTAVAWIRDGSVIVRIHDGTSWGGECKLDGAEAAIAFAPAGPLHAAVSSGLWKVADGKVDRVAEGPLQQPALAFDTQGRPHMASCRDGRIVCDGATMGAGERPSLIAAKDGTIHVAYLSEGAIVVAGCSDKRMAPTRLQVREPAWPSLASGPEGIRVTWLGAADHGPTALWLARLPDTTPILLPTLAGNVSEAWLLLALRLGTPRDRCRPHDLEVTFNGVRVGQFTKELPEGRYLFPLKPYHVFTSAAETRFNRVALVSRHMNGGLYMIAADYRLTVRTPWGEHFAFGPNEEEVHAAAQIGVNHGRPDLAILSGPKALPIARPKPGRLSFSVEAANLGAVDSGPAKLELVIENRAISSADLPPLKPSARQEVPFDFEWDGRAETCDLKIVGPEDFDPSNDTLTFRLWGEAGRTGPVVRADPTTGTAAEGDANFALKFPAGMEEPDLDVLDAQGEVIMTVAPHAVRHATEYRLPVGDLGISLRRYGLSTFPIQVKPGQRTELDLTAAAGLLKIVPHEGQPQPSFDVRDSGDKHVRTVAAHAIPPAEAYLILPGRYRLHFKKRVVTPVDIEAAAGRETVLDLTRDLASLRMASDGKPFLGNLDVYDESGKSHVRTIAPHDLPPEEAYGFARGSYEFRFRERYGSPLRLEMAKTGLVDLDLDAVFGTLRFAPPTDTFQAVVTQNGKHVVTLAPHGLPQAERIGFLPGDYELEFRQRVLTKLPVKLEAGKETTLDLATACTELRLKSEGKPFVGKFNLRTPKNEHLCTIAPHGVPQAESYWLTPGSYRLEFKEKFAMDADLSLEKAGPKDVDLDGLYGFLVWEMTDVIRTVRVKDLEGTDVVTIAPHAFPAGPRVGFLPGKYELTGPQVPIPIEFSVEIGRDVTPIYGEVSLAIAEAGVEISDAEGKRKTSVHRRDVGPQATLRLPEGKWEIRFGEGFAPKTVEVERGKRLDVNPEKK